MRSRYAALALALALVACDRSRFIDDVDTTFDFSADSSPRELHTPYVVGAQMAISVSGGDNHGDVETWSYESTDPTVLRVDFSELGVAHCTAVGPGVAELRLHGSAGRSFDGQTIAVGVPDHVRVLALGPLALGHSDVEADTGLDVRVVTSGYARYLVEYYEGEIKLSGRGALHAQWSAGSVGAAPSIDLRDHLEWLTLSPFDAGESDVALSVAGISVGTLHVVAVDPSEIDHIELQAMDESTAQQREALNVVAQAFDAMGTPIDGAPIEWQLDGVAAGGLGDIYRYYYDPAYPRTLRASGDAHETTLAVHSRTGEMPDVLPACSIAIGRGSASAAGLPLFAAVALAWRRRRGGRGMTPACPSSRARSSSVRQET